MAVGIGGARDAETPEAHAASLPLVALKTLSSSAGRKLRRRRGRPPDRFRRFKQRCPRAAFWVIAGLPPGNARALAEAGYLSLCDLEGVTREELLAIPGVGAATLESLEELLARPLAGKGKRRVPGRPRPLWPEELWRKRGLPPTAAITFAQMGMTLERLGTLSREELLSLPGVGIQAARVCELMIGREIRARTSS